MILRLYEATGKKTNARLWAFSAEKKAAECNLMETDEADMPWQDDGFSFTINPFEIKTFRIL